MPPVLSPTVPRKDWVVTVPQKTSDVGRGLLSMLPPAMAAGFANIVFQPTRVDLVLHVIIAKASASEPVTIFASLENSTVSSGKMLVDKPDQKGWFQDNVKVEMWLEEANGQPRTDLFRMSDGPATYNGTGATSSSVSFSFSGGVNAGFFGGTPTGGASATVGVSDSHGFSSNLMDFRVVNNSDQYKAEHSYLMSKSADGPAYNTPTDLVPDGGSIGFIQAFQAIKLYTPPDLATANLPLLSQCVWQANHPKDIHDTVMLKIRVTQHLTMVDGTNNGFTISSHASNQSVAYGHQEPVPLIALAGDSNSFTL